MRKNCKTILKTQKTLFLTTATRGKPCAEDRNPSPPQPKHLTIAYAEQVDDGLGKLPFWDCFGPSQQPPPQNSFLIQNLYQRRLFAVLFKTDSNPNDHKLNKTHIHRDDAQIFPPTSRWPLRAD